MPQHVCQKWEDSLQGPFLPFHHEALVMKLRLWLVPLLTEPSYQPLRVPWNYCVLGYHLYSPQKAFIF